MNKTSQQIADEIKALIDLKPLIPSQSGFGDDNDGAITAQIEVLRDNLNFDAIDENRDSGEWDDYVYDSAIGALDWIDGRSKDSPSHDWKPLAN